MSPSVPVLQVYSQLIPHDEVYLVGNLKGLRTLYLSLGEAIASGKPSTALNTTSDGEGFYPIIIPVEDTEFLNREIVLPYTDSMYEDMNESRDWLVPGLLSKEVYLKLVRPEEQVMSESPVQIVTPEHIETALLFAITAHGGQKDKQGFPYILHPLTVATQVESPYEKCLALLHDVVEDCDVKLEDLEKAFPKQVVVGVDALTRRPEESYGDFLLRLAREGPAVRAVKRADITHNLSVGRLLTDTEEDLARIRKYKKAYDWLREIDRSHHIPDTGPF